MTDDLLSQSPDAVTYRPPETVEVVPLRIAPDVYAVWWQGCQIGVLREMPHGWYYEVPVPHSQAWGGPVSTRDGAVTTLWQCHLRLPDPEAAALRQRLAYAAVQLAGGRRTRG